MPWHIDASSFDPIDHGSWGNFKVKQDWLPSPSKPRSQAAFIKEVCDIVEAALDRVDKIDAVVFPELALTYSLFDKILESLSGDDGPLTDLQFIVAGSSTNCYDENGNFVLTAIRQKTIRADESPYKRTPTVVFSQRKHHRWKLDQGQIDTYDLTLDPSKRWWESHCIESREIHFFQFRRDAVFASLICEDLARSDPCHDIMRSVAPNLVFALLMDGPQLPIRWPARYAGSLADDPGSTVITLTSHGLVERSNARLKSNSRSVGLIRDSRGVTKELQLTDGHKAILLELGSDAVTDVTIDGRQTNNASEWYFISQRSV